MTKGHYRVVEEAFVKWREAPSKPEALCNHEEAIEFADHYSKKQQVLVGKKLAEINRLKGEIKELKNYMRHDQNCPSWYKKKCNCGLSEPLKRK